MLIDLQHGDPVEPSRVIDQRPLAFSNDRVVGGVPRDTDLRTQPPRRNPYPHSHLGRACLWLM